MEKTVAFCTLGCKVNQYETDAMREAFEAQGYEVREFSESAAFYIINTCTVTNMADRKSRQMMHRAKKKNPDSIIVAAGCYVQAAKEQLEADELIDVVVGNNLKNQIVEIVENYSRERQSAEDVKKEYVLDISHDQAYEEMSIHHVSEHTRAYIKIQDGCNQFCSYCIIPYARGRVRSRQMADVLTEVTNLSQSGYKEIVLTGIHISSYGLDFVYEQERDQKLEEDYGAFKNSALIDLIEAIAKIDGIERIRFGSLEPRIITEPFLKRLSAVKQICPHFHLSLQSGCDTTLKRMNRHYTTALYAEKCEMIRRHFDRPAITTDVITGFPGETQEEFEMTYAYLAQIHFADMHIFKYSKRQGTKAADMPDQIAPDIQNERSEQLLALAEKMHHAYLSACSDQMQEVLLEELIEIDGKTYMTGHSKNYIRCAFAPEGLEVNQIIRGFMEDAVNTEFVFCKRID